jgi:hypothetical protein
LPRRAHHAAFDLVSFLSGHGQRSSSSEPRNPVQVLEASSPLPVSAMAATFKGQSLPWHPSSSATCATRLLSPAVVCFRAGAKLLPASRHTSSHRVRSFHLWSGGQNVLASTAGLTRRCSGPPSAAAELQR